MRLGSRSARRALSAVTLLALVALTAVAGGSAASTPEELAEGSGFVSTSWQPGYLRSGPTNVVVQLAGDPVSVQEDHAGRHFVGAEKQAATDALAATQNAIRPAIEALGGKIIGDYQLAYNGLKVNVDAKQLSALAALPNVIGVHKLQTMEPVRPENVNGVQLIGAPAAWASAGKYTGEGIKVAIIDTGIDYTHANFGGPGTLGGVRTRRTRPRRCRPTRRCSARTRHEGQGRHRPRRRRLQRRPVRRPPAPIPHPDPNPLDCNGHGTHVAGTAAGFGVHRRRHDVHGPVRRVDRTRRTRLRIVGPGVAPEADLYALRVFGCDGLDRRHRRRHRLGRRQRHGRDQHVARLAVRPRRRPVGRRGDQRGQGRRHRRRLRRQQRPEPVHHRLARHGHRRDQRRGERRDPGVPRRATSR